MNLCNKNKGSKIVGDYACKYYPFKKNKIMLIIPAYESWCRFHGLLELDDSGDSSASGASHMLSLPLPCITLDSS